MTEEALIGGVLGYLAASLSFWMAGQGRREQFADLEGRYEEATALLSRVASDLEGQGVAMVDRGPDGIPKAIRFDSLRDTSPA